MTPAELQHAAELAERPTDFGAPGAWELEALGVVGAGVSVMTNNYEVGSVPAWAEAAWVLCVQSARREPESHYSLLRRVVPYFRDHPEHRAALTAARLMGLTLQEALAAVDAPEDVLP